MAHILRPHPIVFVRMTQSPRMRTGAAPPGRPLGIMISPGCGVPAAGRELSTPRPLQTDARLPAEVGRARRAARERGPGLRFSSAAASAGLVGRRRRRKVSCALGPGCPARRTRPAAPPRPRARPACGPRAARPGPALAVAAGLRQRGSRVAAPRRTRSGLRATRAPRASVSPRASGPAAEPGGRHLTVAQRRGCLRRRAPGCGRVSGAAPRGLLGFFRVRRRRSFP